MKLSRRDFAKLCGASAAALGLGTVPRPQPAAAEVAASPMPQKMEADLARRLAAGAGTDPLAAKTAPVAENMEPAIPHPEQEDAVKKRLAELEQKTGKKPNILVFLMAGAPTPNMDRLADEGLKLTSCYSQPTCSPSHATMLTGRLPMRHGILRPPMYGEPGGLQDEITVATILSEAGYVTQGVGKWHCGENEASLPHNVGFDDFYGFLSVSEVCPRISPNGRLRSPKNHFGGHFYQRHADAPGATQQIPTEAVEAKQAAHRGQQGAISP